jgi:hypothetical protein
MAGKSHTIQCTPNPLRDKKRLDVATAELEALGRQHILHEGRWVPYLTGGLLHQQSGAGRKNLHQPGRNGHCANHRQPFAPANPLSLLPFF